MPADTDRSRTDQRIVEAIAPFPAGSAVTGWAGLHLLGARWFDGVDADGHHLDVEIALGHQQTARPRPGVHLVEEWLFDDDVIWVDGIPVTVPDRSVTHLARTARNDLEATRYVDMGAYDDLVSLSGLARYAARLGPRPGTRRLRRAIEQGDENAWSPTEVTTRLLWKGVFPARTLVCNAPVFDLAGRHLFTPDLLDVEAGVAGEYDGEDHAPREQRSRDLTRHELARRHRIEVVTTLSGPHERERFVRRLHGAYERVDVGADASAGRRSWTTEPPWWWVDTSTVSARRALTAYQREQWLGRRRRI
ncbi:hypothetical protein [Nocardioides nitrophenolicus]|uniref:hypothetical protein n=1 Tax=Nocardioides nitrophenolicus TaxID=60489 RepID=UPI001957BE2F|nr:hypothetical protein [Nocardioides nitrophenolicus]MBM7516538.1 hypothetical protein [Nocardioides nitrophenolicus]